MIRKCKNSVTEREGHYRATEEKVITITWILGLESK